MYVYNYFKFTARYVHVMTGVDKCHDQPDWFYEIHVYPRK